MRVNYFIQVVRAEATKQFKNQMHNNGVFFSMLIWPVLAFAAAYYQFKPFNFESVFRAVPYLTEENLISYIMIGYFAMIFFRSFVQSAWRFSFERTSGTLELIYMSPASRLAVMLGNAVASLMTSVWMFTVFISGIFILFNPVQSVNPIIFTAGLLLMLVMSILWGILLNSMFLFTRDSGMLFTILEEPMELFAGVKIPVVLFPVWAKAISLLFPLTYVVDILRKIFFLGYGFDQLKVQIYTCSLLCITMFVATIIILAAGEKHNARTGNMTLF